MENRYHELGLDFEEAYDRVKWIKRVRSWKEVSNLLEKREMLAIIK